MYWHRLCRSYLIDVTSYVVAQAVDMDRLANVTETLLAAVVEGEWRIATNLLEKCRTYVNRIGIGRLLNTGGKVDTIADEVIVFDKHIGDVQAEAHAERAVVGLARQRQRSSNAHGASRCVDGTGEFDEHRVAHRLEQASIKPGNLRADQIAARGEPLSSAFLIRLHQSRIADYIGDQYCCHSP